VAIRAVLFDGMRHFIFVLPLIAALAALVALAVPVGAAPDRSTDSHSVRDLAVGRLAASKASIGKTGCANCGGGSATKFNNTANAWSAALLRLDHALIFARAVVC
jgi:uncharacterized low-complexity protein